MTKAVAGVELVATKVRVHRVTRMLMTIQRVHTQSLREETIVKNLILIHIHTLTHSVSYNVIL